MDIQTGFFAGKGILILTLPTADPPGSFDCVAGQKAVFLRDTLILSAGGAVVTSGRNHTDLPHRIAPL